MKGQISNESTFCFDKQIKTAAAQKNVSCIRGVIHARNGIDNGFVDERTVSIPSKNESSQLLTWTPPSLPPQKKTTDSIETYINVCANSCASTTNSHLIVKLKKKYY